MARDVDLLPWILGGCLCAAAAVAAVALSAPQGSTGAVSSPPAPSPLPQPPAPAAPAAPAPSNSRAADLSPVAMSPGARQQLPSGQVWECEVNGQRVFSDVQCGAHATVRQLNDLNVMDSPTAPRSAPYGYGARYSSSAPPAYYASPPPMDDTPADYSGDPYVGAPFVVVREHNNREHRPHPYTHPQPHPQPHSRPSRN
jgi:hypothetical protein